MNSFVLNEDLPVCRICTEKDLPENLISPCDCRGTQAFIHRRCLDNWFSVSSKESCDTCQSNYAYEFSLKPISIWCAIFNILLFGLLIMIEHWIFRRYGPIKCSFFSSVLMEFYLDFLSKTMLDYRWKSKPENSLRRFLPRITRICLHKILIVPLVFYAWWNLSG